MTAKLVEMSEDELACRLFEAMTAAKRPAGLTAVQALAGLEEGSPGTLVMLQAAARVALEYFGERLSEEGAGGRLVDIDKSRMN